VTPDHAAQLCGARRRTFPGGSETIGPHVIATRRGRKLTVTVRLLTDHGNRMMRSARFAFAHEWIYAMVEARAVDAHVRRLALTPAGVKLAENHAAWMERNRPQWSGA
jgi:hypothetical protein